MSRTDCAVFHPTALEFKNFYEYMLTIERQHGNLGICKIVPPREWVEAKNKDFESSIPDDFTIATPIAQYITGATGFFKVNLIEQQELTLDQIHELACKESFETKEKQMDADDEEKERRFWKSLCNNKTGPIAIYGADVPGSMFGGSHDSSWNVNKLHSILRYSRHEIPGVCSSMMYFGAWRAMFAIHTEDYDLYSINFLHSGEKKCWYSIPVKEKARFESLANAHFSDEHRQCKEYLRHKTTLISPTQLRNGGIEFKMVVQEPGEFVVTWPGAYHQGFNHGFNIAEATNFALPSWIHDARKTKRCLCRSHTVTIDVDYIETRHLREEVLKRIADVGSPQPRNSVSRDCMNDGSIPESVINFNTDDCDLPHVNPPAGRVRCVCGKGKPGDKAAVQCSKCHLGFHPSCIDEVAPKPGTAPPIDAVCHVCYAIDNNVDVPVLAKQTAQSCLQATQELIESSRRRKRKGGGSIQKGDVVRATIKGAEVVAQVIDVDDEGMCRIHIVGHSKDDDEWVSLYGLTNMTTMVVDCASSKRNRYGPGVVYSTSSSNSSNGFASTADPNTNPTLSEGDSVEVHITSAVSEMEYAVPSSTIVGASMSPVDEAAAIISEEGIVVLNGSSKNNIARQNARSISSNNSMEKTADEYFVRNEQPLRGEVECLSSEPRESYAYSLRDFSAWIDTHVGPLVALCERCVSSNSTGNNDPNRELMTALENSALRCKLEIAKKYFLAILKRYSSKTMSERLSAGLVQRYHQMAKGLLEGVKVV